MITLLKRKIEAGRRKLRAFNLRIKALWKICTTHNFILVYEIEEIKINGNPGRKSAFIRRTDYNTESDFYTMKASMCHQFGKQILDKDAKIGDYIPIGYEWDYTITEETLKESGWKYIEVSPFTGKPEWVYGEYINPELDLPGTKFVLITEDDNIIISYYGETIYKRKVTSMKEISEFVKFFK
jgi:hypothetical protein